MPLMPSHVLGIWGRGLLTAAVVGGGAYALARGLSRRRVVWEAVEEIPGSARAEETEGSRWAGREARRVEWTTGREVRRVERRVPVGWNRATAEVAVGLGLLALSVGGGRRLALLRREASGDDPDGGRCEEVRQIRRPDGTVLNVEMCGPPDAPPMVLIHGWGSDGTEWKYARRALGGRYRLIVWDLPGLGRSTVPPNNDFGIDRMAEDLDAVLDLAGGRPALLVGHSIGGMIILAYCRRHPEALGPRVSGLVLAHTTYIDPMRTTKDRALLTPLQAPVLVPLCHLMIALAPLVWALNWLSYFNGSMQRSNSRWTFCGGETREQLDWISRFLPKAWPAVVARGMLGMFRFDETATLPTITVPTLVIMGDRDETTEPDASRVMADRIPGAELAVLSPAKHMGLIEHHARWAEIVDRFAQGTARREPAAEAGG